MADCFLTCKELIVDGENVFVAFCNILIRLDSLKKAINLLQSAKLVLVEAGEGCG